MSHDIQPGRFLVASPAVTDPDHARTVIYVLQHSLQTTLGVVLNRPANSNVKQAWKTLTGAPLVGIDRFSMGGPMGGPVFAIHQTQSLSEISIEEGVYLSANASIVSQLTRLNNSSYRVFLGMTGWTEGTLKSDLEQGNWFVTRRCPQTIFADTDHLWEEMLRDYGNQLWCDILKMPTMPDNALCN